MKGGIEEENKKGKKKCELHIEDVISLTGAKKKKKASACLQPVAKKGGKMRRLKRQLAVSCSEEEDA